MLVLNLISVLLLTHTRPQVVMLVLMWMLMLVPEAYISADADDHDSPTVQAGDCRRRAGAGRWYVQYRDDSQVGEDLKEKMQL